MKRYIYAVDVGGSSIKYGVFTYDGKLLRSFKKRTPKSKSPEAFLEEIADTIKHQSEPINEIVGVGFGLPGPVIDDTVYGAVNLGWGTVNVKEVFSQFFNEDLFVVLENDANIASFGEALYGAGASYKDMVLFTLGTGIGGGVIHNGSIVSGADGAGGEVGHITVDHKYNFTCGCGRKGCVETLASAKGLKNLVKYFLKHESFDSKITSTRISAKQVVDLAKEGDALALKVVDEMALGLAKAASAVSVITNPEVFVIGGGISAAGDFFTEKIAAHYKHLAFKPVLNTEFINARLGNKAALYGAYALVKHHA